MGIGLVTDPVYERWKNRRNIFNHGFHKKYNIIAQIFKYQLKNLKFVTKKCINDICGPIQYESRYVNG